MSVCSEPQGFLRSVCPQCCAGVSCSCTCALLTACQLLMFECGIAERVRWWCVQEITLSIPPQIWTGTTTACTCTTAAWCSCSARSPPRARPSSLLSSTGNSIRWAGGAGCCAGATPLPARVPGGVLSEEHSVPLQTLLACSVEPTVLVPLGIEWISFTFASWMWSTKYSIGLKLWHQLSSLSALQGGVHDKTGGIYCSTSEHVTFSQLPGSVINSHFFNSCSQQIPVLCQVRLSYNSISGCACM